MAWYERDHDWFGPAFLACVNVIGIGLLVVWALGGF